MTVSTLLVAENKTMFDYEYTRHIFGATNSPCVACYAVQRCTSDNADDHPDISAIVQRKIYLDDLYLSLPTDEKTTDTAQILRTVLSTGGLNLTKWSSNSCNFLKRLNSELRAAGANPDTSLRPQRVLEMPWDQENDVYFITPDSYQNVNDIQTPTQNSSLKFTSSIFDPLGLTAPLTIRLRICKQLAWTTGQAPSRRTLS